MHSRRLAPILLCALLLLAGCAASRQTAQVEDPFVQQALQRKAGLLPASGGGAAQAVCPLRASDSAVCPEMGLAAGEPPAYVAPAELPARANYYDFDDEYAKADYAIYDPLEPWNRFWFHFNDVFYMTVWRPLGKGYLYAVPKPVRSSINKAFYNWKFPIRFVNCLLQGKFLGAGVEFSKFVGNTLFGAGGLMDITEGKQTAVVVKPEDFGQTLGYWGAGPGFYFVLPILGPCTARDTVGLAGDYFLDPFNYVNPWWLPYSNPWWISFSASTTRAFVTTADQIETYDALKASAIEPYTAFRNAYVQARQAQIKQ